MWASLLGSHHFEIFAGHDERVGSSYVMAFKQRRNVVGQAGLASGIQRGVCLVCRSVEVAEHLDPVRSGSITEIEVPSHTANVDRLRAEQLDDPRLGAP